MGIYDPRAYVWNAPDSQEGLGFEEAQKYGGMASLELPCIKKLGE